MNPKTKICSEEDINKIHLYNCEDLLCGDILHYHLEFRNELPKFSIKETSKQITKIILLAILEKNQYIVSGRPKTAILFSGSYADRKDLYEKFKKVCQLISNKVLITPYGRLRFRHQLKSLALPLKWNRQLISVCPNSVVRYRLVSALYEAYLDYYSYEKFISDNELQIDTIITFVDVHVIDAYFVQKANINNKLTIALQHGVYHSAIDNGWSLKGSKSKVFLGYGQFTVDEAIKSGRTNETVPVGDLACIGEKLPPQPDHFNNKRIGVILDGEELYKENREIIKTISESEIRNYKDIVFKFHPTSDVNRYSDLIEKYKLQFFTAELSLSKFASQIDVAIIHNSTSLIELISRWIPVYLIRLDHNDYKVYESLNEIGFSSINELEKLLENINTKEAISKLSMTRNYFGINADPTNNYLKQFQRFGIN